MQSDVAWASGNWLRAAKRLEIVAYGSEYVPFKSQMLLILASYIWLLYVLSSGILSPIRYLLGLQQECRNGQLCTVL